MDPLIKQLIIGLSHKLKEKNFSLVTAESCTGGGLAYCFSTIPGCSSSLERGYVVYSKQAKMELLGIAANTLDTYGAVSIETATAMAKGALRFSHAQLSIAITGLAGPSGDDCSDEPIGKVYVACATAEKCLVKGKQFLGSREEVCDQAITTALTTAIALIS